jgi:hypothetical protein
MVVSGERFADRDADTSSFEMIRDQDSDTDSDFHESVR